MSKSVKARAEKHFAATQKKDEQALKKKEKALQERAEQVAGLRALRLAKEKTDAENGAAKNKKSSRLPRAHRRKS